MKDGVIMKNKKKIKLEFQENGYGEQYCWLDLSDDSSIEIICCNYDGNDKFYSLIHHCSEKDFENGIYDSSCGVIEMLSLDTIEEVKKLLPEIIGDNDIKEN